MNSSLTDQISLFLEKVFGATQGTPPFTIIGLIALGSLLIGGWCITNLICSARKGPVVSFFAQLIPGIAAILAWILLRNQVAPTIEGEGVRALAVIGGTAAAGVLTSCLVSKKLLGVSFSGSVISNVLTYACVAGAILLGGSLVREMDSSLTDLSQKKHMRESDTDSIMNSGQSDSIKRTN